MLGWMIVVIAWGCGLAWIADTAASRGRSQVGWTALAAVVSILCIVLAELLPLHLVTGDDVAVMMLGVLAPLLLMFFALLGLGRWLKRQPVKVRAPRLWPVSCRLNGSGKLEILPERVRLIWQDRTQDIPRAQLDLVAADGECVRLGWNGGELVLMPMLAPQTRDGRLEQSQTLARLLRPALPVAIQLDRR